LVPQRSLEDSGNVAVILRRKVHEKHSFEVPKRKVQKSNQKRSRRESRKNRDEAIYLDWAKGQAIKLRKSKNEKKGFSSTDWSRNTLGPGIRRRLNMKER
jgi:hypothetical protein